MALALRHRDMQDGRRPQAPDAVCEVCWQLGWLAASRRLRRRGAPAPQRQAVALDRGASWQRTAAVSADPGPDRPQGATQAESQVETTEHAASACRQDVATVLDSHVHLQGTRRAPSESGAQGAMHLWRRVQHGRRRWGSLQCSRVEKRGCRRWVRGSRRSRRRLGGLRCRAALAVPRPWRDSRPTWLAAIGMPHGGASLAATPQQLMLVVVDATDITHIYVHRSGRHRLRAGGWRRRSWQPRRWRRRRRRPGVRCFTDPHRAQAVASALASLATPPRGASLSAASTTTGDTPESHEGWTPSSHMHWTWKVGRLPMSHSCRTPSSHVCRYMRLAPGCPLFWSPRALQDAEVSRSHVFRSLLAAQNARTDRSTSSHSCHTPSSHVG